jgi:hypothetical protein
MVLECALKARRRPCALILAIAPHDYTRILQGNLLWLSLTRQLDGARPEAQLEPRARGKY